MTAAEDPRWAEVRRLRGEAEDYARKGDMLAASMLDAQASKLSRELREGAAS